MKLHINAFKLTLATNNGPYGATALFDGGLNIIRAENTSGKSTIINGILYALGLEVLVGKKGKEALKPVLWGAGTYNGKAFNVLESFVEIEISNASGNVVTIRRYVAGNKDSRLVEVIHGPVLTKIPRDQYQVESLFVGIEGAAQREMGFHHFLAEFLDLELPYVKKFNGDDVQLYVECIAPLMFIEQIRGWGGIQMTLRHSFGIKNVAKLAVEYILDLDVIENEKMRTKISEDASRILEDWQFTRKSMVQIAYQVGGQLMHVSAKPNMLHDEPSIAISSDDEVIITLDDLIVNKRSLLIDLSCDETRKVSGSAEQETQLLERENMLLVAQAELSELRSDIHAEEDELKKLRDRLDFIRADIQRNKDIKRLRDFGVETGISLIHGICPTCNQVIQDSLVPTESTVMGVEENIHFQQTEAEAVEWLISSKEERIPHLHGLESRKFKDVTNLRRVIRDLRSDLLEKKDLSVATIREQVRIQDNIEDLEQKRNEFELYLQKISDITRQWQENRARYLELPDDYFSDEDKNKLDALSKCFANNVRLFGYRSTEIAELRISKDNYRPISDEFEVAFGASASDNIRLIWAYTLALFQVSLSHIGNHWGILIFDEPEQQQMQGASSDALYKEASCMPRNEFQMIIATSASKEVTLRRVNSIHYKLLDFGDVVIRPL